MQYETFRTAFLAEVETMIAELDAVVADDSLAQGNKVAHFNDIARKYGLDLGDVEL